MNVLEQVREHGYAWLREPLTDESFVRLARSLGEIVNDTPVRLVAHRRTYLTRPDAIPMHTDHPVADLIAWRCEEQDEHDGATLLVDGRAVLATLDEDALEQLKRVELPAMVRLGDPAIWTPVVWENGDVLRLFFAPWLEPRRIDTRQSQGLQRLTRALEASRVEAARLLGGQVLIIDNHRFLHGRGRLVDGSRRRLRRLWIRV